MNDMKYIRTENNGFFIFSSLVSHADMRQMVNDKVISAGFVQIVKGEFGNSVFKCYGKSVSLNLESKEEDSKKINRNFELEPY